MPGVFLAILNPRGDTEAALSDMAILERISPEYLSSKRMILQEADFLVADSDIPEESLVLLLDLASEKGIPVCVEPVSVAKAKSMVPHLSRMYLVTPNREEAEVLVGFPLDGARGIAKAGEELVRRGIHIAIITLGPEGAFFCTKESRGFVPSIPTLVIDSVGAGDALTAGAICGLLRGQSISEAIRTGVAAATLTLGSPRAVSREMSWDALQAILDKKWEN